MGFAVDTEVLGGVLVLEVAVFWKMGTSTDVADVGDFLAVGCCVAGVDSMAFEAASWFREELSGNAPFAADVQVVLYGFVSSVSCAEGNDHVSSSLAYETAFNGFDPSCE